MKIIMLLFACMASPDFTIAMLPGFQLPSGPSVGSSSASANNYDLPPGTIVYVRLTANITLFGNLRLLERVESEIGNTLYGHVLVYGDRIRRLGNTEGRFKYGADLDPLDNLHRSPREIFHIFESCESFLVYIERTDLPPLKSILISRQSLSGTRKVTLIGPVGTYTARGALQQVAVNETVWTPWTICQNEPVRQPQPSTPQQLTPQQLPAPGGSTTAEMNFQPDVHILLRGSEPGFRFENGRFVRSQDATLVGTDPQQGDIVTKSGAPIGRFRDADKKWYPLNLRPQK